MRQGTPWTQSHCLHQLCMCNQRGQLQLQECMITLSRVHQSPMPMHTILIKFASACSLQVCCVCACIGFSSLIRIIFAVQL